MMTMGKRNFMRSLRAICPAKKETGAKCKEYVAPLKRLFDPECGALRSNHGLLVAAELATGTFYLLMLAIGGRLALAAHAGGDQHTQMIVAAVVGAAAVFACYWVRRRRPGDPSPRADRSVNLDVGEVVQIEHWNADGTAQVRYRGAPGRPSTAARHRPGRAAPRGGAGRQPPAGRTPRLFLNPYIDATRRPYP
jgi:membrane protein implicated in regulation of membrane protease activity